MSKSSDPRLVGLIGHPVGHSISPQFQQAAFDAAGLHVRYERWDTAEGALEERMQSLRDGRYLGANVTVPHKQAVLRFADDVDGEPVLVGAANTIVNRDGRLVAFNTDVGGFRLALRGELGLAPAGKAVAVIGAGGAARAVVAALDQERVASIVVLNRTLERALRLVSDLKGRLTCRLEAVSLDRQVAARLDGCGLVVNCTSVGLAGSPSADAAPVESNMLPKGAAVVDIIANPVETPLLRSAAVRGHAVMGGLPMLVHQGALAFELWTGQPAPLQVMMSAARRAMGLPVRERSPSLERD